MPRLASSARVEPAGTDDRPGPGDDQSPWPEWRRATSSFRAPSSRSWVRLAACAAVALGPLTVALVTEGGSLDPVARTFVVIAVGAAVAAGAVLVLRRSDTRESPEDDPRERALREARDQQAATAEILSAMAVS